MEVIILAAGKGTRMNSDLPKVLHEIGGKPMVEHVVEAARELNCEKIHLVVGFGADKVSAHFKQKPYSKKLSFPLQAEQLGTGHAVFQAMPLVDTSATDNQVLVLYGDVPLITSFTLKRLIQQASSNSVCLLTAVMDDPSGFGRIVRDDDNDVIAIVEQRDASPEQLAINEINTGILCAPAPRLKAWLEELSNDNEQGEYYLTDIIAAAVADGCAIEAQTLDEEVEAQGVNDKIQLAMLERVYQGQIAYDLMRAGVTLRDPSSLTVRGTLTCGRDVVIDSQVRLEGEVHLADGVSIESAVTIRNCTVAAGAQILTGSHLDGGEIGSDCQIGPNARIRPGTVLAEGVKIGNFVETKNTQIGKGSKANHLAYIGDAIIGEGCNIGAGTIFCNYDGANKHQSTLGNNVFVGSNSTLVSPVNLADDSFVAAGSTINKNVNSSQLAIARGRQKNLDGWARPVKKTS
jgi:bifunctional UDP-N-acetylglucosamine pyrophosphorylase/glucosamine-1-phosphate N-acetyltransferase